MTDVNKLQAGMEDFKCTGQVVIGDGVNLKIVSNNLKSGIWSVTPAKLFTGPGDNGWMAQGRLGESLGPNGSIIYNAADRAKFKLDFDVPYNKNNTVSITCEGEDCELYAYSVSRAPESGRITTPIYKISRK